MKKRNELLDLFYESKNRSIKWEKYFQIYDILFSKYKDKKITFVEIGVLDGGSLEIWKKYFGENSRIIGIDKNKQCQKLESSNYEIFIGSQSDPNFWRNFFNKVGNVDIILDDGGHTNDQQIISLLESANYINDGGLHVVEDVHASYQKHYGNPYKFSFINFSKKTIDDINFKFPNLGKFNHSLNKSVYSVEFFESIVVFKIDRKLCVENILLENKGLKLDNSDVTLDSTILLFRKKFAFLYKFKIMSKIERIYIKFYYQKKSKTLKKFFN